MQSPIRRKENCNPILAEITISDELRTDFENDQGSIASPPPPLVGQWDQWASYALCSFLMVDELDWLHDEAPRLLVDKMSEPIPYEHVMEILSKRFRSQTQRAIECVRLNGAAIGKFVKIDVGMILLPLGYQFLRVLEQYGSTDH
jgi:hypothetical protein